MTKKKSGGKRNVERASRPTMDIGFLFSILFWSRFPII